jgi:hypothetical protein
MLAALALATVTIGCSDAALGEGGAPQPKRDLVAGPAAFMNLRAAARRHSDAFDGSGYKSGFVIGGDKPVTVTVHRDNRRRVGLVYRHLTQDQVFAGNSVGDHRIRFVPCMDRKRTGWPGGIVVGRSGCVRLSFRVEGGGTFSKRFATRGHRCRRSPPLADGAPPCRASTDRRARHARIAARACS